MPDVSTSVPVLPGEPHAFDPRTGEALHPIQEAPAPVEVPSARGEERTALDTVERLEREAQKAEGVEVAPDDRPTLDVRDETYHLEVDVPSWVLMKLGAASDPRTSQAKQASAIVAFLQAVIVPEELDRFENQLETTRPSIDFEELNKIMVDASEAIGERPTQP